MLSALVPGQSTSSSFGGAGYSSICLFRSSVTVMAVGYPSNKSCRCRLQCWVLASAPTNTTRPFPVNPVGSLWLSWRVLRSLVEKAARVPWKASCWGPSWHLYMANANSPKLPFYPSPSPDSSTAVMPLVIFCVMAFFVPLCCCGFLVGFLSLLRATVIHE